MPTLFKRSNGIYYAILSDEPGRRKWISTGERRRNLALKKITATPCQPQQQASTPRLSEFYREFSEFAHTVYSKETVGIYKRAFDNLIKTVGNIHLGTISQRHVDLFRSRRLGEVKKVTVNIELRTLRAAFFTAVRWEILSENPFQQVRLCHLDDEPPLFFSLDDFQSLLAAIESDWLRDVVVVAVLTGMRRGELLNLRWDMVDFNRRLITIQSHGNFRTKQGKRRTIPMNVQVARILEKRHSNQIGDLVFHVDGIYIDERRLTKFFKRCIRRAKLNDRLHFHNLRHSFASWLVQGNVSLYQVQKLLGHSNIRVTEIYSHLLPESMHSTVEKLQVPL